MIQAIRALLQFTTILPVGKTAPFENFARNTWLYPLAGYLIGTIAATVLCIPAPPLIMAVLAVGIIILISGANHLDALFDLGDGLMAHGSPERRIQALTDRQTGTGAIALGLVITLLSISSLACIPQGLYAASAVIIAETGSKWTMAFLTVIGKPFHEGLHATLHSYAKPWFLITAAILMIPAFMLPLPFEARISAGIILIAVPLIIRSVAYRLFGGINGDITGGAGEISRCAVLILIAGLVG